MRDGDHRGKARPVSAPRPIKDARDEQPPRQPTRDKVAPIVTEPIGPEVRARFLGEGLKAPVRTGGELQRKKPGQWAAASSSGALRRVPPSGSPSARLRSAGPASRDGAESVRVSRVVLPKHQIRKRSHPRDTASGENPSLRERRERVRNQRRRRSQKPNPKNLVNAAQPLIGALGFFAAADFGGIFVTIIAVMGRDCARATLPARQTSASNYLCARQAYPARGSAIYGMSRHGGRV